LWLCKPYLESASCGMLHCTTKYVQMTRATGSAATPSPAEKKNVQFCGAFPRAICVCKKVSVHQQHERVGVICNVPINAGVRQLRLCRTSKLRFATSNEDTNRHKVRYCNGGMLQCAIRPLHKSNTCTFQLQGQISVLTCIKPVCPCQTPPELEML
jgi:hypothetical protein